MPELAIERIAMILDQYGETQAAVNELRREGLLELALDQMERDVEVRLNRYWRDGLQAAARSR